MKDKYYTLKEISIMIITPIPYLRKLINIPDNEEIIIIYACGYPTSEFKYVTSVRNDLEKSMVVV